MCVLCLTRALCSSALKLNPNTNALQRSFVTDLKRADELERKLRFFRAQIKAQNIPVRELEPGQEDPEERDAKIDSYEVRSLVVLKTQGA